MVRDRFRLTLPAKEDRRFQMVTSEHTLMTTKGFSARAERCLANASRVVVSTGPFFGGKIAVEDSNDDACLVYGDPNSPQDAYTLDIDHKRCGSRLVNGSKMETNIIVHENRDIITHNTRRYLVVCSFLPDTYTITASVNLPLVRGKKKSSVATHTKVPGGLLLANARLETSTEQNEVFTYQRYKDSNEPMSRAVWLWLSCWQPRDSSDVALRSPGTRPRASRSATERQTVIHHLPMTATPPPTSPALPAPPTQPQWMPVIWRKNRK
ncbi:hypothetical protein HPB51_022193 [Rhipicephalus microplus]|uniref:ZP domain-containing protein n=1 Tax=Rhipicephalus microplus TaxID=6941 RepID=A0A9J6F7S3_RHIMP|nr:hypothetical protein HPB51_022193 [Rhipicephalus microplus]